MEVFVFYRCALPPNWFIIHLSAPPAVTAHGEDTHTQDHGW